MTRRKRIRLLVLMVLIGVPALAALILLWYLKSGRLEQRVASEYAEHFPGALSIEKISLAASDRLIIDHLKLSTSSEPGGSVIVDLPRATVQGSLMPLSVRSLDIDDVHIDIEKGIRPWLIDFLAALPEGRAANKRDNGAINLHVSGDIDMANIWKLQDLELKLAVHDQTMTGSLTGNIGGAPLEIAIETVAGPDGTRLYEFNVRRLSVSMAQLFGGLSGAGLMAPVPNVIKWIPDVVDAAGSIYTFDPGAGTLSGTAALAWQDGTGSATLFMDRHGLKLHPARADDAGLGSGEGDLAVDFARKSLLVELPAWKPGPRLPIPKKIPIDEALKLTPMARVEVQAARGRVTTHLSALADFAQKDPATRFDLLWVKGQPALISAKGFPLTLAQGFIFGGAEITAGRINRLSGSFGDGKLHDLRLAADGAVVTKGQWSFGETTVDVDVAPLKDGGFSTTVRVPMASFRHDGDEKAGTLLVECSAINAIFAKVRGPHRLPDLNGLVFATIKLEHGGDELHGAIEDLRPLGLSFGQTFRNLDVGSSGKFILRGDQIAVDLAGQITRGDLFVPNSWIDVALHTPVFTTSFTIRPDQLVIDEILARAGTADGQPENGGYTSGIRGALSTETLAGTLSGVIDHADLEWLKANTTLVPLPKASKVKGEGALTFKAVLGVRSIERVDGYFLPLNADFKMPAGDLDITGIKGALKFEIVKAAADTGIK